jgi:hypothetical protein
VTTGVEIALVTAALASSAAAGYSQYQGSKATARAGEIQAAMKRDQAQTSAATSALSAREQEADRRRRAGMIQSSGRAFAALAGLDSRSGSLGVIDAENERLVEADLSGIRILGAGQQRRFLMEGRGADNEAATYSALGANAWVQPTVSFLGSASRTGLAAYQGPGPDSGGVIPKGDASGIPASTMTRSSIGRAAGPV